MKNKARLVYIFICILGTLLSGFVYLSSQQVKKSTNELVDKEIPIFRSLQALQSSFTEQERYLYEYYATQQRRLYQQSFTQTAETTRQLITALKQSDINSQAITDLDYLQTEISELAATFDSNMFKAFSGEDWDLARIQLAKLTALRLKTKPIFDGIAEQTRLRVQNKYQQSQNSLRTTSIIVLLYSLLIIALAFTIGRYISSYIVITAQSKRLSLFVRRNPNPILSFDSDNALVFSNPATQKLLTGLSMTLEQFCEHLTPVLNQYQEKLSQVETNYAKFEFNIEHKTLECELHQLVDLQTWDLHLIDISLRKQAEKQLNYQAYHHQFTGLLNQNKLYQDLQHKLDKHQQMVLGNLEIKQYSQMVTSFGTEITAKIVREFAIALEKSVADNLSHAELYQTSEKSFSLLLNGNSDDAEIEQATQLITKKTATHCFYNGYKVELYVGFCRIPEHANTISDISKCLNIALEKAIESDHLPVVIYTPELGKALEREIDITERLRVAIDEQALELYFQPQLDIKRKKIVGLETLIRWQTDQGFISPGEFIPLAEKSGLIIPLGEWILTQACIKAKQLVESGLKDLVVAINISPQQFKHPGFYPLVCKVLQETGVNPINVELEITEGVIMYNESGTIALLKQLKETGVQLSIDDFGTGYSSLSYLKQFPIDKLKIDQSFVRQLACDDADKAIVSTIIDLGSHLGLKLIAEGVEEQEQQDLLLDMGCDEIQGYYFSRPLSAPDLDNFLAAQHSA